MLNAKVGRLKGKVIKGGKGDKRGSKMQAQKNDIAAV
jgi:hypothetical protein